MTTLQPTARVAPSGDEVILDGLHYLEVLSELHRRLRPRTYLEIGTWKGASLRVASCASLAVDPMFQLEEGVIGAKPMCVFYQSTSDEFFAFRDPVAILGKRVDLAFIDALHVFEYALRDFIGTERSVAQSSIIVLDDPCPRDYFMARRSLVPSVDVPTKYPGYWTGDVWKLVPVLREYRPDITLTCIDTLPTGLMTCTNLNPDDRTLVTKYDEIVARWREVRLEDYGLDRLLADLQMQSAETWVSSVEPLYPGDPVQVERPQAEPTQAEIARELAGRIDAMQRSRSWQITRPLRWLSYVAREVRRGSGRVR
jgi:hypothetical protein